VLVEKYSKNKVEERSRYLEYTLFRFFMEAEIPQKAESGYAR
jgi:hypothetical protein